MSGGTPQLVHEPPRDGDGGIRQMVDAASSRALIRKIIDSIPTQAHCNLPDGTNEFSNKRWQEYTGLSSEESSGWGWQRAYHPEDLPRVMEKWQALLVTGEAGEIEARLRRHDGVFRWFLFRSEPLRDETGRIVRWYGANVDIDDRKQAEELDRAKTAFLSNVSHEFRTPLTLMLGPLDEVLPDASERLSPEHHELLVAARSNGIRLLKLVNTLLDFSRIEAGRAQASYQPTDLAGFTTEIASAFDSAMKNAGLSFSIDCRPIADPVYVDRDMWEKVVLNLLSNAYKFTFEGEVALTLKSADGAVELQVRDTGVGIPEEHRERVFERFHRIETTQARTYEGTGIGLALVKELVNLHSGSVRVESAVGAGSTFTVTIPSGTKHLPAERIQGAQTLASTTNRAEAYAQEARRSCGESGAAVDGGMLGKRSALASRPEPQAAEKRELIVVADDNADMRLYIARLLSERYEVHAVVDGRQALEATQRLRPALVLADVMMPHLDGFGLLRAIREDSALGGTPVILVSARAGEESRVEGLEADADDYLIKPFAARELLARVAAHVKMSNLRRETAEREERMRGEAELEREKLRASEERLAETSRLYGELRRSDAELQLQVALLQQLPVSAWTLNPDGTPDFVNRVWLEFAGQTPDFIRSHPEAWMTAVHPEDREVAARTFWEGVHSGQGFAFETRSLRAEDQTYRWHLQQAVVLRDVAGQVVKFVGTTTDIDDQKRAQEKLRASESDLLKALDSIPGWVATFSPTGHADFFSRRILEYFGKTREEVMAWATNDIVHPNDLPRIATDFANSFITGDPLDSELRYRRADGVYRWFQVRMVPARNTDGELARWYSLVTDIDDQKRAEEALRQALGDLARINRVTTMGELTASLAHELSQPISGAITNANVCLRKLESDKPDLDEVRAAVTRFGRDARRAAEIIARIRSQFEKGSVNRETFGVSEMIRETVALLRDEATRYNISVRMELAADLPQIIGDRVQLQQVAMNLIVNSIEAMKDVDRIRELVVKSQLAENEQILVTVSDTGPGFPPDRAERIFDPFFTTKPHGTGMGLRISRSIIESHGGRLWAEAAAGRGATFHLNLPVAIPGHSLHTPKSIIV